MGEILGSGLGFNRYFLAQKAVTDLPIPKV
jgi:hypothetical protein